MKKIILCLVLASFSGLVLASGRVQIPVQSDSIAPHTSATVPLMGTTIIATDASTWIEYNITCTVISSMTDTFLSWAPANSMGSPYQYKTNGQSTGSAIKLAKGLNTLEIQGVFYSDLIFNNIDNTGKVTIKQCYADPIMSNKK